MIVYFHKMLIEKIKNKEKVIGMTMKRMFMFVVLIISACTVSAGDSRIDRIKVDGETYYSDGSEAGVVFTGEQFEIRAKTKDCPDGHYLEYKIPKDSEEKIKIISQTRDGTYYVANFKVLDATGNAEVLLELKDSGGGHKGQSSVIFDIEVPYVVDNPTFDIDSSQGDKKKVDISIDNGLTSEQERSLDGEWDVTILGGEKTRHFSSKEFSVDLPGGYSYHVVAIFTDKLGRSYQGEEDFLVKNLKLNYRGEEKIEIISAPTVSRVEEEWSAKFKILSDGDCIIYVSDGQKVIRRIPYNASEDSKELTINYVFNEPGTYILTIEAIEFAKEKPLATATIQIVVGDSGSQIGVQQDYGQPPDDYSATSHNQVDWYQNNIPYDDEREGAEEKIKEIKAQNKESPGFEFSIAVIMFVLVSILFKKKD